MADVKKNPAAETGPVDFDKLGGTEVFFDRPIATFKLIPVNTVVGFLVASVWLQKPKDAKNDADFLEPDEDDLHANEWEAYIIYLTRPCLAMEGTEKKEIRAGREVYLPASAKLREFGRYIGHREMFEIAVTGDGMQPRKEGPGAIQKYRHKILTQKVREGHFLALGGPAAVSALGAGGVVAGQTVTASPNGVATGVPQGTIPVSANA